MAETREVRTAAFEVKFLVPASLAPDLRGWARQHLEPDPHGGGPHGDEYRTSSLYLDTGDLDVFHRRGSYGRSKYRIRRYGEAGAVFLERKLREPSVLAKRRTPAGLDALERLGRPGGDDTWAGRWFQERMAVRRLSPICQVSYSRTARLAAGPELARLTLDEHVTAVAIEALAFADRPGLAVLEGKAILELKFRHHVPAVFRRLIEDFRLEPGRASKYRFGLARLRPSLRAEGESPSTVPTVAPDGAPALHV